MRKKTFGNYIKFLRKHNFEKEARYYETDVTQVLATYYNLSIKEVMNLPAKDIVPKLNQIYEHIVQVNREIKGESQKKWDVELTA